MDTSIIPRTTSPFEAIKQTLGTDERWSARDLMPLMGYSAWRNFEVPIERAMKAAENQGIDLATNFAGSRKISATKPQQDYLLSRFAAYLVAMNGDPNKPPVAAAQAYFAIRTREAEVQQSRTPALPQDYEEALTSLLAEVRAHKLTKARVAELEPAASAWGALVEATGDYSVADAAKMLSRDPGIQIGQNTLFRWLGKHGWLYRRGDEWHPYQEKVDAGLVTLKANRPYWDSKRGVGVLPAPTVRITAKGVQKLYTLLGGMDALVEVASWPAS